jgi:hypothetical protein
MALVIPRTKTVDLGGGQTGVRQSLRQEIMAQSLEDVRTMLREITIRETQAQIDRGNPPQLVEVDGQAGKPVTKAEKRTVVIFGATLAAAAMRIVEVQLAAAIRASTVTRSGALADIAGHWQWLLVTRSGAQRVSAGSPPAALTAGDRLILMPVGVPYATNVNQAVDGRLKRAGGVVREAKLTRRRRAKGRGAESKGAAIGFLEAATSRLKGRSDFRQFSIYVAFTRTRPVPGERSRMQGSPMIVIRPRRTRTARVR